MAPRLLATVSSCALLYRGTGGFQLPQVSLGRPSYKIRARAAASWEAYQAEVKARVQAIGDRLDVTLKASAPSYIAPPGTTPLEPILLEDILASFDGGGAVEALVSRLQRWHFAVVRVPKKEQQRIEEMWRAAEAFYEQSDKDRMELAGPVRPLVDEDKSLVVVRSYPTPYRR